MTRLDDLAFQRTLEALQHKYWLAPRGKRSERLQALRKARADDLKREVKAA